MENLHIDCPHCGSSFDVDVHGKKANMIVFSCAHCKAPLVYCNGMVGEMDAEGFADLRKKLTKVIQAAVRQGPLDEVTQELKKVVEESIARADVKTFGKQSISDESLSLLEKDLSEMDVDSFLENL